MLFALRANAGGKLASWKKLVSVGPGAVSYTHLTLPAN